MSLHAATPAPPSLSKMWCLLCGCPCSAPGCVGGCPRGISELTVRLGCLRSPGFPECDWQCSRLCPAGLRRRRPSYQKGTCPLTGTPPVGWRGAPPTPRCLCANFSSQNSFHSWPSGGALEPECLSKLLTRIPACPGAGGLRAAPSWPASSQAHAASPALSLSQRRKQSFPPAGGAQGSGLCSVRD